METLLIKKCVVIESTFDKCHIIVLSKSTIDVETKAE